MSKLNRSVTVEQRKTAVQSKWEIYYVVRQTINTTSPKINDELSEDDINSLIDNGVKITIKPIS